MEIKIALAGNPNCGKTTLFNDLTGSSQYVGNWPGVTVEKKEGKLKGYKEVIIQDLPGIYSLSPYTLEEVVAREYLVKEKPDVIINIIDGTNIERNLYLTTQLAELGIPLVLAINMIDVVHKNGDKINIKSLGETFGCKAVEMSALRGTGTKQLIEEAITLAKTQSIRKATHVFEGSVEHAIAHIEESIEDFVPVESLRWHAIKIFERDTKIMEEVVFGKSLAQHFGEHVIQCEKKMACNCKKGINQKDSLNETASSQSLLDHLEEHVKQCEQEMDDDAESIIINQRYDFITKIASKCVKKKNKGKLSLSDKIDRIVTNRILALPIFAVIMFLVYYISVTTIGDVVTVFTNDVLFGEWIQPAVTNGLESIGAASWLVSLVVDGIIGGLAAPIGFAPQMAILFFFLAILEDCGYMARVAFIMDRAFRRFGLSGKSFIPMLISSGCAVPGIMATRTIENEKDRRMTMITTSMIPCGAKLPVIALFAGALMGGAWWMAPTMYFVGIAAVIISCIILKKFRRFAGDIAPFVMELPSYHIPSAKGVLRNVWERVSSFLKKAGTVLFVCCAVMWFLATFGIENGSFGMVETANSFLAKIGSVIAPIFAPLGFGSWDAVASALSGFVAKEAIVSTMGVLTGLGDGVAETDAPLWTAVMGIFPNAAAAVSFLIFNLLDSPCLAAISTLSNEMQSRKWTAFAIIFQNIFAYCIALMVYQFGLVYLGGSFSVGTIMAVVIAVVMLVLMLRPQRNEYKIKRHPVEV